MDESSLRDGLKVLMTADTVGGVWTYCVELCKALQRYNVKFHLVTMGAKMKQWQLAEVEALENVHVYETEYKLEWMQNAWDDVEQSGKYLLELEERIQPDLIHLNSFSYGSLPFKAPKITVAHSDVFSWWKQVLIDQPSSDWSEYYERVKEGLQQSNHLIAPSNTMKAFVNKIYKPQTKSTTIYNSRNSKLFYNGEKQPYIFSMGRVWDEGKNIKLLIEAASKIKCEIRIAGDNTFETDSLEITGSNITFLGKLSTTEIARELSSASIYVLPAKYEPFGLSALEAALSGCALVLGDIDSLREVWQESAVYVNTNDAVELATTINNLFDDKAHLSTLASKAERQAQQYSTEKMATAYFDIYKQLAQQNTPKQKYELA
jgi:glycosyltransferase involved in cell wall biosynthesis